MTIFSCEILWDRNLEILLLKKGTHRKCRPVKRRIYTTKESNTLALRLLFEIQSLLKKDLQLPPQSLEVHGIWKNVTSTGNKEKDSKF